jgi:ubiquinone/menaquinone biosynthesis C-methylase UbiE
LSFDRAAEYYDRTRAWPDDKMAKTIGLLSSELRDKQPCLDAGTGTGRIALPLASAGIRLVGVDLSTAMLTKFVEKNSETRVPLVVGDVRRLPFSGGTFGGALVSWVFHLIADWDAAASEIARTVRPGGVILVTLGGTTGFGRAGTPWQEIHLHFLEAARIKGNIGANSLDEVDAHMAALGMRVRKLEPIRSNQQVTAADLLTSFERASYSFTWQLDADSLAKAVAETKAWAEQRFGSLDSSLVNEFVTDWRAYDLP